LARTNADDREQLASEDRPAAIRTCASTRIARPAATVFAFVVDGFFDNYPRWSPEVVELEPLDAGRIETGARVRQVRVDHGRRSDTTVCVTACERVRLLELEATGKPLYRIRYELADAGTGHTTLELTFELVRLELYMRPFERLIRRAIRGGSQEAIDNIRALVEAEC